MAGIAGLGEHVPCWRNRAGWHWFVRSQGSGVARTKGWDNLVEGCLYLCNVAVGEPPYRVARVVARKSTQERWLS